MNDGIEHCPDFLDEVAIQAWKNVCPKLWGKGLILPLDSISLGVMCCVFSTYIRGMEEAKANPDSAEISLGVAEELRIECRKWAAQFFAIKAERTHLAPMTEDGYDQELLEIFEWKPRNP